MREYVITLPLRDNGGLPMPVQHMDVSKALVRNFSGYTFIEGTGAWMDNGVVQQEPVVRYIVAADDASHNWLRESAVMFGKWMGQKSVYFVGKDGVEIIDIQGLRLGDRNAHQSQEESKLLRSA